MQFQFLLEFEGYLSLERAYLDAAPGPGAQLIVHVEGGLAPCPSMEGSRAQA